MPDFVGEIDEIIVCADGKLTVDHIVHEIVPVCERVERQATFFEDVGGDKFTGIKVVLGMGGIDGLNLFGSVGHVRYSVAYCFTLCAAGTSVSVLVSCGPLDGSVMVGHLCPALILAMLTACTLTIVVSIPQATTAIVGTPSPSVA